MLKSDFHMHSMEDPRDTLDHSAFDLIDYAANLEYKVLSLTLHGRLYYPQSLKTYAASKGILLIPGIEIYIEEREILLLGADAQDLAKLKTFEDLRALKKHRGNELLVIAPHPFYILNQCVGDKLEPYADLFDAIEFCHFYTSWWNPNLKAHQTAKRIQKPLVACSDTHYLAWMKQQSHYCLLDAKPTQNDVFTAIRAGQLQNISRPLTTKEFSTRVLWHLAIQNPRSAIRKYKKRLSF